jgi:hypothetical protein
LALALVAGILDLLGIADIVKSIRRFKKTIGWLTRERKSADLPEVYFEVSPGVFRRGVVMNEFKEPALDGKTMCGILELHPLSQSGHLFVVEKDRLIYSGRQIDDLFLEVSSFGRNRK